MRYMYFGKDEISNNNLEVMEHNRGAGINLCYVKCVFDFNFAVS